MTVGNSKEASRQSSTAIRRTNSSIFYIESSETDFHTTLQRRVSDDLLSCEKINRHVTDSCDGSNHVFCAAAIFSF